MATLNLACQPPDARQCISTVSSHPVCGPWYSSRGNLIDTPAYVTFKGLLQWSQKPTQLTLYHFLLNFLSAVPVNVVT